MIFDLRYSVSVRAAVNLTADNLAETPNDALSQLNQKLSEARFGQFSFSAEIEGNDPTDSRKENYHLTFGRKVRRYTKERQKMVRFIRAINVFDHGFFRSDNLVI